MARTASACMLVSRKTSEAFPRLSAIDVCFVPIYGTVKKLKLVQVLTEARLDISGSWNAFDSNAAFLSVWACWRIDHASCGIRLSYLSGLVLFIHL